jgi:glycosyltransferase involved in cell wall biosynthesis
MEAMACGLPVIISSNTGHLDLIEDDNCIALTHQSWSHDPNRPGWGTSDIDEIVDALARVYRDREHAKMRGQKASQFMEKLGWAEQIHKLIDRVDDLLS